MTYLLAKIDENDVVIMFNFSEQTEDEITEALTQKNF